MCEVELLDYDGDEVWRTGDALASLRRLIFFIFFLSWLGISDALAPLMDCAWEMEKYNVKKFWIVFLNHSERFPPGPLCGLEQGSQSRACSYPFLTRALCLRYDASSLYRTPRFFSTPLPAVGPAPEF